MGKAQKKVDQESTDEIRNLPISGLNLGELLKVGWHSQLFEAHDEQGHRWMLKRFLAHHPEILLYRNSYQKNWPLLHELRHPQLVYHKSMSWDETSGLWIQQEYCEGKNLNELLSDKKSIDLSDSFKLIKSTLESLDFLHQNRGFHGNLCPTNVMVDEDMAARLLNVAMPVVTDIPAGGAAADLVEALLYQCPERLRFGLSEASCDIYSTAVLLYRCLTGKLPFGDVESLLDDGLNLDRIIQIKKEPIDIRKQIEHLPAHTADAIMKALSYDAKSRFQTCQEFFFALVNQSSQPGVAEGSTDPKGQSSTASLSPASDSPAKSGANQSQSSKASKGTKIDWKAIFKPITKAWKLIVVCFLIIMACWYTLFQHYANWNEEDLVYFVESAILDWKFQNRGEIKEATPVGVLAIDERSLAEFGRWPFSRRYYAQAFDNLKKLGVKWIGFDTVWAEPEMARLQDAKPILEKLTPKNFREGLERINEMSVQSESDRIFVDAVRRFENIVMGYFYFGSKYEAELNVGHRDPFLNFEPMLSSAIEMYDMPAEFTLKDYPFLSRAYGVVPNTPFHSQAVPHFAFFSNDADDDAINRWVTLLANIDGNLMPSLSLKTAAEYLDREIFVFFDGIGVESIVLVNREDETDVIEIPIDAQGQGRLLLNHRGPNRAFQHFSLVDAYNNSFSEEEKEKLKGSVLLLGATAIGMNDMRPNPFDATVDGVENHAAAMDNIIKGQFMKRPPEIFEIELYIVIGVGILFAPLMIWGPALISGAAALIFMVGYYFVDKYIWFDQGIWAYMAIPYMEILSMFIVTNMIKYISEERDKKFLKSAFGSYISPELIDEMYDSGEPPKLGGHSGILSAYFTDIQSFSSFSEQLTATQLVELLNEYLTAMTDILLEHKGTLDKYEGDAIIAFFGAPMTLEDHATRAVTVAVRMQEKLLELREKWVSEGDKWPDIVKKMRMRIGINSGEIVTGNMGSRDRMNYTMMGDSVNLAARLEEAAKQYGIFTQISHFTRDLAGPENFEMRELDTIRVVGKTEPVTTYDVLGIAGETPQYLVDLKDKFHHGLSLYKSMKWDEAIAAFEQSLELEYERFPDLKGKKTNPSLVYIDRCKAFKENPPPADWDGVYTLTSK